MPRSLPFLAAIALALPACSDGGSSIDERFAEACANTPMLAGSEPCRNPDSISDERKEAMIERMGELEEGMDRMQQGLDDALEEARREAEAAQQE